MVQSLVVHIGDHKAGSTAIQRALGRGAVDAGSLELCYPRMRANHHNPLAKAVKGGRARLAAQAFAQLAEQMAQSDAAVGILSAEAFEGTDPAVLQAHLAQHFPAQMEDLRIVAYVRPHAERLLSSYAENLKIGLLSDTLEAFHQRMVALRRFFYLERFEAWRATFGAGFVLRPMIRSQLRAGDVVQDFLHVALRGAPFTLREMGAANPSLPIEDLAVLRSMQIAMEGNPREARHAAGWRMAGLLTGDPAPQATRLALHADLAAELVGIYREDAAAMDAAFFSGPGFTGRPMTEALEAAPQRVVAAAQSVRAEDHFDADTRRMLDAFARLAADLMAAGRPARPAGGRPGRAQGRAARGPGGQGAAQGQAGRGPGARKAARAQRRAAQGAGPDAHADAHSHSQAGAAGIAAADAEGATGMGARKGRRRRAGAGRGRRGKAGRVAPE